MYQAWCTWHKYSKLIHCSISGMLKCVLGWCLPLDYQKLESPIPDGAVHVDIDVEILDILSINDKEFSITMSMYFSVQWQESRYTKFNFISIYTYISIKFSWLSIEFICQSTLFVFFFSCDKNLTLFDMGGAPPWKVFKMLYFDVVVTPTMSRKIFEFI